VVNNKKPVKLQLDLSSQYNNNLITLPNDNTLARRKAIKNTKKLLNVNKLLMQ